MKKISIVTSLMLFTFSFTNAQETIIQKKNLPKNAQLFIEQNFKSSQPSYIKKDQDLFSVEYDVVLNNGIEINFDSKGNWEEVNGNHSKIPTQFISKNIVNYVNQHFKNTGIVKIERSLTNFEVKLSNQMELIFNTKGNFIRIDN